MRLGIVLTVVGVVWCAAVAGCESSHLGTPSADNPSSNDDCGAPDHVVYDCAPQSPDLAGCPADDADASYAEGCQKTLPVCLCCYPGPEICYCENNGNHLPDGGSELGWGCPI
jgi:hypothetical protein